jgi:hypothetical protein
MPPDKDFLERSDERSFVTPNRAARSPHNALFWLAAAILSCLAWCAIPVSAAEVGVPPKNDLDSIVVTGRRLSVVVPDADVKERVESAMRSDPFFTTNISPSR